MTDRALWTVDAMAAAMRARREGPVPEPIAGLSIDSRTIEPGEAFFAIKGESRDGHAFVAAAFDRGAGLAVVAADKRGLPVAYIAYEWEQHGFRRAENIKRSYEAELYFYSKIFQFNLADQIEPVTIENLDVEGPKPTLKPVEITETL